ncbi:hypothetical protein GWK47_038311 [Chionoecetes opilio]|uniref:Uncharacterized protein n=1 Tax=Chionoecetes opilio TaxID=41210 RepID=A0A8J4YM91_CHIOP|nr:hypothetical protein GWK47_038311 [Chionoecetes opilio]
MRQARLCSEGDETEIIYVKIHMKKPHLSRPHSLMRMGELYSSYLKRSTSLIHLVEALECARRSLSRCVCNVITLPDCVVALVRAKVSDSPEYCCLNASLVWLSKPWCACEGDGGGAMPNDAALAKLRKNNIAVRVSHTSQLLPPQVLLSGTSRTKKLLSQVNCIGHWGVCGERWFSRFRVLSVWQGNTLSACTGCPSAEPLLMTGSFNWTWSAVVNNFENVIISRIVI